MSIEKWICEGIMKRIYVNAQWQGGADPVTLDGAKELVRMYLDRQSFAELPVSADISEMASTANGIRGFDVLRRQMGSACERLREDAPDKVFTLGGGCDADVPVLAYLSEKYRDDLTVNSRRKTVEAYLRSS